MPSSSGLARNLLSTALVFMAADAMLQHGFCVGKRDCYFFSGVFLVLKLLLSSALFFFRQRG